MKLTMQPCQTEDDYLRIRSFLREVFLLNDRREHSWHVARRDYWRWHLILNLQVCDPVEKVATLWETAGGQIVAVLHPVGWSEVCLHVHPHFRTAELEGEMLAHAEQYLFGRNQAGERFVHVPAFADDTQRQKILAQRRYTKQSGVVHHWHRDLEAPIPETSLAPGYVIRSMGDLSEHPARSWASWRALQADEPDENYDGDWS
jgi:hypothetical protein